MSDSRAKKNAADRERGDVYKRQGLVCMAFYILKTTVPAPVFNLFFVWTLIIFIGAAVRMLYHLCRFKARCV